MEWTKRLYSRSPLPQPSFGKPDMALQNSQDSSIARYKCDLKMFCIRGLLHMLLQNALQLMAENETLQSAIQRTERDTIEVITFLKKEDSQKDKQVRLHGVFNYIFMPV